MLKIVGYPDRYSVAAGEKIAFKISLEEGTHFDARIVQVVNGDCNPEGPGIKFVHMPSSADRRIAGRHQAIDIGSYMTARGMRDHEARAFTFTTYLWPTLPLRGDQVIASQWDPAKKTGFSIGISDKGCLSFTSGDGSGEVCTVAVAHPMLERHWYRIAASYDSVSRTVTLVQRPLVKLALIEDADYLQVEPEIAAGGCTGNELFYLAGQPSADGQVDHHFDGKIDTPVLLKGASDLPTSSLETWPEFDDTHVIARWDFSLAIEGTEVVDLGPYHRHGSLVHLPARGMKGWNWNGECQSWRQKPEHYGAIHFHHDDLYDAGWETSVEVEIPQAWASRPYALHVRCGESDATASRDAYIPFFVRPPREKCLRAGRPSVLVLAPTASYLAYCNHAEHITARGLERQIAQLPVFGHTDMYMYDHPELGGSLYDTHADGSGVCYSSRLRPNLNFAPQYQSWLGGPGSALYQYNADTHLFDWLDHQGVDYDIITDEDLHEDGFDLLEDYRVVVTGTHPEYHSTPMWDAMKAWIDRGGRLMYMGGNGWYWRIAFHNTLPGVIEVRRAEDGIRAWIAEPGEYYHSFTGEYGGLWRRVGRPPNLMCAVGFVAQGPDLGTHYRRAPDADNPRAAFIFEDVPDEIIGDFGLIGGGAVGVEIDCISTALGSPPNVLRLATSEGHGPLMLLVKEEFGGVPPNLGGDQNDRVRCDMAFAETPSGGAIFSTSSIAWCGSLLHNNYDNNVSKITCNVLKRFMEPANFLQSKGEN